VEKHQPLSQRHSDDTCVRRAESNIPSTIGIESDISGKSRHNFRKKGKAITILQDSRCAVQKAACARLQIMSAKERNAEINDQFKSDFLSSF